MDLRLRARWVFPVEGPPIEAGVVEIHDSTIAAVCRDPATRVANLGNVALLPGLVNAHTHLELGDLSRPIEPARPFTTWLRAVIEHRRQRGETASGTVEAAWRECLAAGTTLVGDIVTPEVPLAPDAGTAPRGVAFLELLGLRPERAAGQRELAERYLESAAPGCLGRGLSPHAPYSVHPDLFKSLVSLAQKRHAPVAMHLAESREELELLDRGTGAFVGFLSDLGVWDPRALEAGMRPLDYVRELARLDCALVVHGNYLDEEEIELAAECPAISVVYCPRTHAWFGHPPHPWRHLVSRGVNVALGTDSRASNPDLSLFDELKFLASQHPMVDPASILRMGTLNGAQALGLAHCTGSLAPGKSADLAAVALPEIDSTDPYELLLHPASRPVGFDCAGV